MDPDRWTAITGAFAAEREQIEQKDSVCDAAGSARKRIFHSRLPSDVPDVGKNKISVSPHQQRGESEKMLLQGMYVVCNLQSILVG